MKTTLICFSGSGNSLMIAEKLAELLGDASVVTLPAAEPVKLTEQVGIVAPVYASGLPAPLYSFLSDQFKQLDLSPVKYLFSVFTCGFSAGYAPLMTERLLMQAGAALSYTEKIRMPETFIPVFRLKSQDQIDPVIQSALKKCETIAEDIRTEAIKVPHNKPFFTLYHRALGPFFSRKLKKTASRFTVTDSCTKGGVCIRECPQNNVRLEDGQIKFDQSCSACFRCVLHCPKQAILFNGKPVGYYKKGVRK